MSLAVQMKNRVRDIHEAIERLKEKIEQSHAFLDSHEGMEEAMIDALRERGYEVNESV